MVPCEMTMRRFYTWVCGLLSAGTFLCGPATAQYYQQQQQPYPYGYYQQPYYQQPYYQQQQPQYQYTPAPTATPRPQQPKPPAKESAPAKPPSTSVEHITGPFTAYTWANQDRLADLAKISGISTNEILALNNIAVSQLRNGQVLRVPEFVMTADRLKLGTSPTVQRSREVWRGIRGRKRIALTIDVGADKIAAETLVKNLKEANAPATFFVTGDFAKKNPALIELFATAGPVHNHSWSHPDFTTISPDEMRDELEQTDKEIAKTTGLSTKPYWRPPFGARDKRVLTTTGEMGYQSIYWTLDTLDSVGEPKSADFVLNRLKAPPKNTRDPDYFLDGGIVLMHVGKQGTADAIPEIVRYLRERGFTLVTVKDLLDPNAK